VVIVAMMSLTIISQERENIFFKMCVAFVDAKVLCHHGSMVRAFGARASKGWVIAWRCFSYHFSC